MAKERSTKPYLIRAICEWCATTASRLTSRSRSTRNTRVPMEYVKNGEIVLNVSPDAAHRLTIGDDMIQFAARFAGVSRECSIPVAAVQGIFAQGKQSGAVFPGGAVARGAVRSYAYAARPRRQAANCRSSSKRPGVGRALSVGSFRVRICLPAGNHATLYNYTLQMRSALENDRSPRSGNVRKVQAMGAAICATAM